MVLVTVYWAGTMVDEDRVFLEKLGAEIVHEFELMPAATLRVPLSALERLAAYDRTRRIEASADAQLAGC